MKNRPASIALLIALAASMPGLSLSAGLPPWEFGMSKADVSSFHESAPYRAFTNGDIETFSGIYDGRKENIQFYFDATGLRRIGIYLYEGTDVEAARMTWLRAYESLQKKFGAIDTHQIAGEPQGAQPDPTALSAAAALTAEIVGKAQMAPATQPSDMFVSSSFWRLDLQGSRYYYVVIFLDPQP